jgi:hypothetical protein
VFYRQLLKFRQNEPAMQIGRYIPAAEHANMLAFFREHEGTRLLVAVNLAGADGVLMIPRHRSVAGKVVVTRMQGESAGKSIIVSDWGRMKESSPESMHLGDRRSPTACHASVFPC